MSPAISESCYRCRQIYHITEADLTPLGYLCDTCFDDTIRRLSDGAVPTGH